MQEPQRELGIRRAPSPRCAPAAGTGQPLPGAPHTPPRRAGAPTTLCLFPPYFWVHHQPGAVFPPEPPPRLPRGFAGPGASPALPGRRVGKGRRRNLPGLTVAALPTLARRLSRPPVTPGQLRGGSVPAPSARPPLHCSEGRLALPAPRHPPGESPRPGAGGRAPARVEPLRRG